jgi:hypothetical protein
VSQAQAQPATAVSAPAARPPPWRRDLSDTAHRGSCATDRRAAERMDTPSRLRLLSLGVVVLGVLTGLVGALVFSALAYSLAGPRPTPTSSSGSSRSRPTC